MLKKCEKLRNFGSERVMPGILKKCLCIMVIFGIHCNVSIPNSLHIDLIA